MWILNYGPDENPEIHGVTSAPNIAAEWCDKGDGYYTTDVTYMIKCPDPYKLEE
jgi:hypothetical protein